MYPEYLAYRTSQIKQTIHSMIEGFIGIENLQADFNGKCLDMFLKTDLNKGTIVNFLSKDYKTIHMRKDLFPVILIAECIYLECIVLQEFHESNLKEHNNDNMISCLLCSNIINFVLKENFSTSVKKEIARSINDETTETSIRNLKKHVNKEQEDYCYKTHFTNNLNIYMQIINKYKAFE